MDWPYAYTPYIWPMLASAVWLGALALYSWRHRAAPGALALIAVTLIGALLAIASAFELAAEAMSTKTHWFMVRSATGIPIGVAGIGFVLHYAGLQRWAAPSILALLAAPLLPQVVFYVVAPDHHLLWKRLWEEGMVRADLGPVSEAIVVYTVVLLLTSLAIMLALLVRSPLHRWPVGIMLLGLIAVLGVYALQTAHLVAARVNLTVLAADVAGFMLAIALVRFRFFSLVPIACETVFERSQDGVVVLNAEDRVADMNRAAETLLGRDRRATIGEGFAQAVGHFPKLLELQEGSTSSEVEIEVGHPSAARVYQASIAPLTGKHGFHYGRLMVLQDITALKRTQQRLSQELHVLATLQERERMARELHDALSQELAFINLQAQAARDSLAAGKSSEVDDYLSALAAVARQAHIDVRGLIAGLTTTVAPEGGLQGALGTLVQDYRQRYNIQAEFVPPDDPAVTLLEPAIMMQLLRIVQEALTNARKHACAQLVCVRLVTGSPGITVVIEDDGCGFDPETLTREEKTFGLGIMRQRAEDIGATLEVDSAPGGGTRITVQLPPSTAEGVERKR